jgi:hypothetical protein
MIKSNEFKLVPYPDDFTDDDKLEYDNLYAQAEILHAKTAKEEPFIIHTAIIGHIRAKKGMAEPYTNEELEAVKNSYILKSKEVSFDPQEQPYLYDKENNPMYYPSKLVISCEENNSNIIVESNNE